MCVPHTHMYYSSIVHASIHTHTLTHTSLPVEATLSRVKDALKIFNIAGYLKQLRAATITATTPTMVFNILQSCSCSSNNNKNRKKYKKQKHHDKPSDALLQKPSTIKAPFMLLSV